MSGRHNVRRGRHERRGLGAVALVLLASNIFAAHAEAPQAHGYWWRLQTGGTNLSPPAIVPPRGLWVSNDGAGQHAVSAVRYQAPPGTDVESLTLTVAGETGSTPVLLACPSRAEWKPAEAGAWAQRPRSECDVAFARGQRRGGDIVFDVRGLARNGELDVVILAPADLGTAFSISFEPPGGGSIATRAPGATTTTSPPPSSPRSSPRPTGGSSVLETTAPQPAQTPSASPTASPDSEGASSPLGDALRELADEERTRGGNGFLWLLAGIALAIVLVGWRVRVWRSRPGPPPSAS